MVDISSQSNKVNITVSSSGVSSNVNASGDASHYYSEKAREWATSNRIVDGVDYSSKYYAEKSNQSALNAQSFAQSAQDSYNNVQNVANNVLADIDMAKTSAIDSLNSIKDENISTIESKANEEIENFENLSEQEQEKIINLGIDTRANVDLSNLSTEGRTTGASLAMPSNKYIDLTLGASGTTYTAPANGWLTVDITATALRVDTSKKMFGGSASDKGSINTRWSIKLCKGDTFTVRYLSVSTVGTFAFIYAQGEV